MSDGIDDLGTIVTGGLVARTFSGKAGAAGGGPLPNDKHHSDGHGACLNCGTPLVGAHCHACGQPGHLHKDATGLLHDIAHGVFHFEGRTWHTLPLLATKPGHLTRRYIDGERVKFVSPMALFLFSVFLMFAVVSNLAWTGTGKGGVEKNFINETAKGMAKARENTVGELSALEQARSVATTDAQRARIDAQIADTKKSIKAIETIGGMAGTAKATAQPEREEKVGLNTGISWLDQSLRHASENPELLAYKIKSSAYKYSWALIPISLPFIWMMFLFRRGVGLYDHAIFATYSLAAMSLLVVVLVVLSWIGVAKWVLWTAFSILPPIHMYKQLKYGYGLGRFGATWRTFTLLMITTITSSLFVSMLFYMGTAH